MRTAFIFVLLLLLLPLSIYSAPCYGSRMPSKGSFVAGSQTYVILRRYLEAEFGKVRSSQHFFQLSYGITDWLSLDLKGGAGNIKQHPIISDEVDYSSSFAGGYGLRLKFYEQDKLGIVFGFQHISVHPQKAFLGNQKNKAVLDDWQTSLLASYDCSFITPYLGTKWSRLDYIHWRGENRKRKMSDLTKMFGLVAGFDIPIGEKIWLNFEGQAFDGEAFAFGLNYAF